MFMVGLFALLDIIFFINRDLIADNITNLKYNRQTLTSLYMIIVWILKNCSISGRYERVSCFNVMATILSNLASSLN